MSTKNDDLARPRVASQTEWDAERAAVTELEEAAATAVNQLAAARRRML